MYVASFRRVGLACVAALAAALVSSQAEAQTCNDALFGTVSTTGSAACLAKLTSDGRTVDDIFRTSDGKSGQDLIDLASPADGGAPAIQFGKLVTAYPGCNTMGTASSCFGANLAGNRGCPGGYTCTYPFVPTPAGPPGSIQYLSAYVNTLDWAWAQGPRLAPFVDPTIGPDGGTVTASGFCPPWATTVGDGVTTGYNPWEALVFDLNGPANKVVLFPINDHGPQPCESVEYTIYLTNDPTSRVKIDDPTTTGADPSKWNRAKLSKIFLHGWTDIRDVKTQFNAGCGDVVTTLGDGGVGSPSYSVEADSFTSVWSLPCGINFRYAAVISGNDGKDFPQCNFDSFDDELDAVLGLSEQGNAVCPDRDGDTYVDCSCPTAPPVCDCDDNDPATHPNAPEACDAAKDFNCNGHHPEVCAADLVCNESICIHRCGIEFPCAPGATCQSVTAGGTGCVPTDCTVGGCPPGSTCDSVSKKCVPKCDNVVCPPGEKCLSGECQDLCRSVVCAAGFTCVDGTCTPPCSCFASNVGCSGGLQCDRPNDAGAGTNQCVSGDCVGVTCTGTQRCAAGKGCVAYCDGVKCPIGEVCVPPAAGDGGAAFGCVNLCDGVTCMSGSTCDITTGKCAVNPNDGGIMFEGGADFDASDEDGSFGGGDGGAGFGTRPGDPSGCGCTVAGGDRNGQALAFFASLGIVFGFVARRRNRK